MVRAWCRSVRLVESKGTFVNENLPELPAPLAWGTHAGKPARVAYTDWQMKEYAAAAVAEELELRALPTPAPGQCPMCGEYSMAARAHQGLYGVKVEL